MDKELENAKNASMDEEHFPMFQVLFFNQHKGADGKTRGWGEVYCYFIMAHRDPWSAGAC